VEGTHRLFSSKTEILMAEKILEMAFTTFRLAHLPGIITCK